MTATAAGWEFCPSRLRSLAPLGTSSDNKIKAQKKRERTCFYHILEPWSVPELRPGILSVPERRREQAAEGSGMSACRTSTLRLWQNTLRPLVARRGFTAASLDHLSLVAHSWRSPQSANEISLTWRSPACHTLFRTHQGRWPWQASLWVRGREECPRQEPPLFVTPIQPKSRGGPLVVRLNLIGRRQKRPWRLTDRWTMGKEGSDEQESVYAV